MSKLQDKIYELAKLRENWTLLADMLPAEFIDAVIFEIQKQDARIAELEAENAKLRGVIGLIPDGEFCQFAGTDCKHLFRCYTIRMPLMYDCRLFNTDNIKCKKCAACLAAFPNGNKGE